MSRIRIIGGKLTEIVEGDYNIYSEADIVYNSATEVTETEVKNGVSYGEPKAPPQAEIKPKKIKFRPYKISPYHNIIAVVEKIENTLQEGDVVSIDNKVIKDNWISVNGKLYLIPKNIFLFGTTFFKVNDNLYQSLDLITNCISAKDYMNSIDEQIIILKEFINDIETTNLKYKNHIKDRLSRDGYSRLIHCIQEVENLFLESQDYENIKKRIIEKLEN